MRFPAALSLVAALGGCVDPAQEAAREELICTASKDRVAEAGRVGVIFGEYDCNGEGADSRICKAASDLHDALMRQQDDLSVPNTYLATAMQARCGSAGDESVAHL